MEASRFQFNRRINCDTASATMPNIRWHSTFGVTSHADLASPELVPESSSGQALETTIDTLDGAHDERLGVSKGGAPWLRNP